MFGKENVRQASGGKRQFSGVICVEILLTDALAGKIQPLADKSLQSIWKIYWNFPRNFLPKKNSQATTGNLKEFRFLHEMYVRKSFIGGRNLRAGLP